MGGSSKVGDTWMFQGNEVEVVRFSGGPGNFRAWVKYTHMKDAPAFELSLAQMADIWRKIEQRERG